MARRLRARSIKVIVYDEQIPLRYYTFDFIHWTREGHAMIAAALQRDAQPLAQSGPSGGADSIHRHRYSNAGGGKGGKAGLGFQRMRERLPGYDRHPCWQIHYGLAGE
jgi:hypothetical protein